MLRSLFVASALFSLVLGFQNCSEVEFESNRKTDAPVFPSEVLDYDPESRKLTEAFFVDSEIKEAAKPVDVIWVVDNSGSMSEEAAWVERNVVNFAEYLSRSNDARMTVVSQTSGRQGVSIPSNIPRITQIAQSISSTNALVTLAKLINNEHDESNKFHGSIRAGVPKAVIIVSDDNSSISANDFLGRLPTSIKNDLKSYHSIVALENKQKSPCMARPGSVYWDLSNSTNGTIFNICEQDWSEIFASIAVSIENTLGDPKKTSFKLGKSKVEKIISVSINGRVLSSNQYSLLGGNLSIQREAFLAAKAQQYQIKVEYIHN